ncbi:MAG: hypothetical protein KKC79_17375 [Gammaproteobacteria bacterium]|nr:hypothetical protein [Gammaproteobacteria bacterium]MBU2410408.1 hypothetical protein [Gammaproteobacteria bacterium]
MSYIAVTLNHFRAIQEWTGARQAEAHLDMKSFELEVRWQQGRCVLRPQFLCSVNGNLSYTSTLGPDASAFIGWLPYRPMRWSMSSDERESSASCSAGACTRRCPGRPPRRLNVTMC